MFKFDTPARIILSSSCLIAFGCLVVISSSGVQTSTVDRAPASYAPSNHRQANENDTSNREEADVPKTVSNNGTVESRMRRGRFYGSQQQSALADTYAAAYAAANAPSSSSGQHSDQDLVQSAVQGSQGDSFASFGESAPQSGSTSNVGAASTLRQLPSASDYVPHPSYYSAYSSSPSSQSSSYGSGPLSSNYHHYQHHYRKSPSLGYPSNSYDRQAAPSANYYDLSASSIPLWAQNSIPSSGGLMSSASSALSSWTGGFGIAEIICTLVAISIGAVILGAPFFLIYLALMGNFSGSGTLSLTNPTGTATPASAATATVNGRRKRLAIFEQLASPIGQPNHPDLSALADTVMNKLSPYIDMQQVSASFKRLVHSIDKYSNMKPEAAKKKSS